MKSNNNSGQITEAQECIGRLAFSSLIVSASKKKHDLRVRLGLGLALT